MEKNYISLNENDISVRLNKSFTKKEKLFLDSLIKNKEDLLQNNISISILKIKKKLFLGELENILKFIQKLMDKKIIYSIYKLDILEQRGSFAIISSYYIEKDSIKLKFSEEFISIFKKNSYFQKNDFEILFFLQNEHAITLYNLLKFNISMNKSIEISISKLKTILNLTNSYDRFFDFEKLILKPAINEITNITGKSITYTKIKNINSSNSKIIGLFLEIKDINEEEKIYLTNKLISIIEKDIPTLSHKQEIWSFIFKLIDDKGFEYIKKNIQYTLEHFDKNNFFNFLIEALNLNYFDNRFKNKIKNFHDTFKQIENIEKKYDSLAQLHSDLFKILANLQFNYLTLNPHFLKSLQNLRLIHELEYFDNEFIIFAEYNTNSISYISLFEN
ncbi:replication initiation protein [Fusobacterium sp.]|uniref:replication initiation protein n=1 Tax=Fusobacterium sp. TaxID=68766 RepID=UPI0025C2FC66|nr:replication initiation protein [Fusobacterium sp.]